MTTRRSHRLKFTEIHLQSAAPPSIFSISDASPIVPQQQLPLGTFLLTARKR